MELHYKYDGTDDHMDSRDIEDDIQNIQQDALVDGAWLDGETLDLDSIQDEETRALYAALIELRDDAASANEGWEYGIQFVREESADEEWAQERARDFGVFQRETAFMQTEDISEQWPFTHIDWQAAADALHADSQEFEFRGVTYFED